MKSLIPCVCQFERPFNVWKGKVEKIVDKMSLQHLIAPNQDERRRRRIEGLLRQIVLIQFEIVGEKV